MREFFKLCEFFFMKLGIFSVTHREIELLSLVPRYVTVGCHVFVAVASDTYLLCMQMSVVCFSFFCTVYICLIFNQTTPCFGVHCFRSSPKILRTKLTAAWVGTHAHMPFIFLSYLWWWLGRQCMYCVCDAVQEATGCWSGCMSPSADNHSTPCSNPTTTQRLSADYVVAAESNRKCYVWPTQLYFAVPYVHRGLCHGYILAPVNDYVRLTIFTGKPGSASSHQLLCEREPLRNSGLGFMGYFFL